PRRDKLDCDRYKDVAICDFVLHYAVNGPVAAVGDSVIPGQWAYKGLMDKAGVFAPVQLVCLLHKPLGHLLGKGPEAFPCTIRPFEANSSRRITHRIPFSRPRGRGLARA